MWIVYLKYFLAVIINIYDLLILIRCLLSFMAMGAQNKFTDFIYGVTEPLLAPVRALLAKTPLGNMMLDFSPVVVILLLNLLLGLL